MRIDAGPFRVNGPVCPDLRSRLKTRWRILLNPHILLPALGRLNREASFLVQVAVGSALAIGCSHSNEPLKFQTPKNALRGRSLRPNRFR